MAKKKTQKKARILNAEEAAKLVEESKDDSCLDLSHITELDVGVAEALAKFKGYTLSLGGLETLSNRAAKALAKFEGYNLSLEGLRTLSGETAEALAKFSGPWLHLNGLRTLSDKTAQALVKFNGNWLYLNGLQTLSDKAAKALAKFKGSCLSLDGLQTLSDKATQALAKFWGSCSHLKTFLPKEERPEPLFKELIQEIVGEVNDAGILDAGVDQEECLNNHLNGLFSDVKSRIQSLIDTELKDQSAPTSPRGKSREKITILIILWLLDECLGFNEAMFDLRSDIEGAVDNYWD